MPDQVRQSSEVCGLPLCAAAGNRAVVIEAARRWIDTPWRHRARINGVGVDCANLVIAAFADAGVLAEFDPDDYPPDWMLHRSDELMLGQLSRFAREVETPEPGDVIVWKVGRCFSHIGIVVAWPELVIHAFRPFGRVVESSPLVAPLGGLPVKFFSFWNQ